MKNTSILIVLSILFCQGCSTYSKISSPLPQALDNGKVKVTTSAGKTMKFDRLSTVDGEYYGITGENKTILTEDLLSGIYPSVRNVYKVWVHEMNTDATTTGYLYSVDDASLQLSRSMILLDAQTAATQLTSIPVSTIQWIKIRRKGAIGKGYAIGTFTGMGVGLGLGILAASNDDSLPVGFEIFALSGIMGTLGSIVGLSVGATSKKKYTIKGDAATFSTYQGVFQQRAIKK